MSNNSDTKVARFFIRSKKLATFSYSSVIIHFPILPPSRFNLPLLRSWSIIFLICLSLKSSRLASSALDTEGFSVINSRSLSSLFGTFWITFGSLFGSLWITFGTSCPPIALQMTTLKSSSFHHKLTESFGSLWLLNYSVISKRNL